MSPARIRPIFILSVQRSGSTLLQRLLATHTEVATVSEPWLLLPFLYSTRRDGIYADYDHSMLYRALSDFVEELPDGWTTYKERIRDLALGLYRDVAGEEPRYFVDKTPRYALVLDELTALFPDARFVFVWRNPLAVVASIIETWGDGKWNIDKGKIDVYDGLFRLVHGYERISDKSAVVRYEELVTEPAETLGRLFRYLDLDAQVASAEREFSSVVLKGRIGDPHGTDRVVRVDGSNLTKWHKTLNNPFRKSWSRRYLSIIGRERLAVMGYDIDTLRADLDAVPTTLSRVGTDVIRSSRGLIASIFETKAVRSNIAKLPSLHSIHRHS